MSQFVRICSLQEAPAANAVTVVDAPGRKLCLAHINGEFYAMDNDCPHRLGPLGEGTIEDGLVLCPYHAWGFDPKTGTCRESAQANVRTYPVHQNGDALYIETE